MIKYVHILLVCSAVSLSAFMAANSARVPETEQIVALRRIGHKLLLASNDTVSRVLPVKRMSATQFQIHFEAPVALNTDALADITTTEQKAGLLPQKYVVAVHSCADSSIQYAYNMPLKDGVGVPCLGRRLPEGCYYIQLTLLPQDSAVWLSAGAVPLFLLLGWQVYRKKKTGTPEPGKAAAEDCMMIGSAAYYPVLQKLALNGETIALTGKEARVLGIFAANINREVSRERLQKEVWEDEGVIVGRSLDMFISKLRKKLQGAPGIQIISIHGKGYKLVVEG